MRWRQRTDDARRTKGDPPATYEQLLAQVQELEAKAQALVEPAVNLRKQCDNLIVENARLRVLVGEKTEYAEQLAQELAKANQTLAVDPDVTRPYIPEWEQFLEDPEGFHKTYGGGQ